MNGNNSPPFTLSLPVYAKREATLRACSASFLICGAGALNHHDSSNNRIKYPSGDYEDNDSMSSSIISIRTMSDNENDNDGNFDDRGNFFNHRLSNERQIVGDFSRMLDYGRNGGNNDGKFFDDVVFDEKNDENDDGSKTGFTLASVAINHFDTDSLLERSRKGTLQLYSDPLLNCNAEATEYIVQKRRFVQNYCSPSRKVYANVADDYIEIKRLSILLFKQFAFATGVRTFEGLPILTFPNRNLIINYGDYKCLISYLHQNLPYDDTYKGYVLIIDRRLDKWANVKTIFGYISNYFPAKIKAIYLVKPNGVLQKALEVGFKRSIECFNFPLIICNVLEELHCYLNPSLLTADLQGNLVYNHFEWVRNCMDVEKMKASAKNISESLTDFANFLRDGDMYANDASTTKKLIESQIFEHQTIKRDFISVRRQGYSVLQQVRRVDLQPNAELLSPTRLYHVTTVERLLLQLEDTERSLDNFWSKHEVRLGQKFQLRSFEEEFKKTNLSRHISHVEEYRQIGNNVDSVNALISKHRIYMEHAEETMTIAEKLREKGEYLMKQEEVSEMAGGSLKPKCDELDRLNKLLKQNLENRLLLLRHSKKMHEQIGAVVKWGQIPLNYRSKGLR
uniref:CRAL-TRIO domain-containing protein n=1 Tax=Romanomermis culicivorax TaxID=13658 RepID=A0A915J053_ROMCU